MVGGTSNSAPSDCLGAIDGSADCFISSQSYQTDERTDLFLFDFVISFLSAAPSRGLSSSKEHSRSSETDMTAPKFWLSAYRLIRGLLNVHRTLRSS